jgi:hypothetical protein
MEKAENEMEKNEPSIAFVKSDGFEKTVCFVWSLLDLTYKVMKAYRGFHLEADFDPEAPNTYFKFYPPIKTKGNVSDDTKQEN